MVWDYAEANPFCASSGNWSAMVDWIREALDALPTLSKAVATQRDAATQSLSTDKIISTDPPYYDNIG
ncbi:MAG: hypothetical protein NZU74_20480, partial [Chloroflexaceae bacterium]|nr:hypothetical protein [Chloroflexaceae bacterium]